VNTNRTGEKRAEFLYNLPAGAQHEKCTRREPNCMYDVIRKREREMLLRLAWLCVRACIWFMCSNIKIICRERRTGFKTSLTSLGWLRGSSCWDKITRLIVRCGFWCAVILLPTDQEMHFTYHVLKAACCRSWRNPAADKSNWRIQKCARSQLCRPHHHAGA